MKIIPVNSKNDENKEKIFLYKEQLTSDLVRDVNKAGSFKAKAKAKSLKAKAKAKSLKAKAKAKARSLKAKARKFGLEAKAKAKA